MRQTKKLAWWEPTTRRLPEIKRELSQVYSPGAMARIAILAVLIAAIIAVVLQREIPGLEVDWVIVTLKALGGGCLIIVASVLVALIPRYVTVTLQGISVSQGQSGYRVQFVDIAEATLHTSARTLHVRLRDRPQILLLHIPARVSLNDLKSAIEDGWKHPVKVNESVQQ